MGFFSLLNLHRAASQYIMKPTAVSHLAFLCAYKLGLLFLLAFTSFNFMEKKQSQRHFYNLMRIVPLRLVRRWVNSALAALSRRTRSATSPWGLTRRGELVWGCWPFLARSRSGWASRDSSAVCPLFALLSKKM